MRKILIIGFAATLFSSCLMSPNAKMSTNKDSLNLVQDTVLVDSITTDSISEVNGL